MTAFPQSSDIFSVSQIHLHNLWITSMPISPVAFISSSDMSEIPSKPAALPSLRCFKAVATSSFNMLGSISPVWVLGMVWIMLVSDGPGILYKLVFFPSVLDLFLFCENISHLYTWYSSSGGFVFLLKSWWFGRLVLFLMLDGTPLLLCTGFWAMNPYTFLISSWWLCSKSCSCCFWFYLWVFAVSLPFFHHTVLALLSCL